MKCYAINVVITSFTYAYLFGTYLVVVLKRACQRSVDAWTEEAK
jgi:hypothetical protein